MRTDTAVERLGELIRESRRILAFTGAGISTESGIPDFRSPGGLWTRYAPIQYDDYMTDPEARAESWRRGLETYPSMADAEPNSAHLALADLERREVLLAVVTQNIDGLHQRAGHAAGRVIELHGNAHSVRCVMCDELFDRSLIHDRVRSGEAVPDCPGCGGILKTTTISFGEPLDDRKVSAALLAARECDLCLVIGSSLVVYPAASVPERARMNGARLAVVNAEPTHLDGYADVVARGRAGEILPVALGVAFG